MRRIISIFIFIAAAACGIDRNGPAPISEGGEGADPSAATEMATWVSGSASETDGADGMTAGMTAGMTGADTTGANTTMTGADTTGASTTMTGASTDPTTSGSTGEPGNDCDEGDWGHYTCQGWIAGLYANNAVNPANYQFVFNNVTYAECVTIPICEPFAGDIDSEFLFGRCKAACDAMLASDELPVVPFPASPPGSPWTLQKEVCVFAPNGNNGTVPQGLDGVDNQPSSLPAFKDSCDNIDPVLAPQIQQVIYEGCFDNDVCAVEFPDQCVGWNPGARITSSLNTSTRAYTTTIKKSLIADLMSGDYSCIYAGNEGLWMYTATPAPERFKFKGLKTDHFYYRMGFRNDDWGVKIRKNLTGSPWYSMTTFQGMADAFNAFNPGTTSFILEFYRGTSKYTMNLTFVN